MEAALLGVEPDGSAVFRRAGSGTRVTVPRDDLSEDSQTRIDAWAAARGPLERLPPPAWPRSVTLRQPSVRRLPADAPTESGVAFATDHYTFLCDREVSISVVQDLAGAAEGTRLLLASMPLPIADVSEADGFVVRILADRAAYERAGGPPGSAGVFVGGARGRPGALLLPLESIGVETFNSALTKGAGFTTFVLAHELAHQAMEGWLPYLPFWLREGFADYVAMSPMRAGTIHRSSDDLERILRERAEFYRTALGTGAFATRSADAPLADWLIPLDEIMELAPDRSGLLASKFGVSRQDPITQHRYYFTSLLLTYFFLHLDGDGEARRIRHYLGEIDAARTFFASRGEAGRLPDGAEPSRRGGRGALRGLNEILLDGRSPDRLEAEFLRALRAKRIPL